MRGGLSRVRERLNLELTEGIPLTVGHGNGHKNGDERDGAGRPAGPAIQHDEPDPG